VQRFRILVDGHFWERLSLQRYAATLGVSKGHLNRMVRKQTGMTASNLVQERIVVEAKRMLTHMSTSILDIANSLGFKDPAYFARLFKKRTGQTPKQFKSAFDDTLKAISADNLKK
jgi:AraC family transcriptional activator of pobA